MEGLSSRLDQLAGSVALADDAAADVVADVAAADVAAAVVVDGVVPVVGPE